MGSVSFTAYRLLRPGAGAVAMLALGFWYEIHPLHHVPGEGWTILVLAGLFIGKLFYEALRVTSH